MELDGSARAEPSMQAESTRRAWLVVLGLTVLVALAIRLLVAIELPNILWPDEIFQSMEQAHRLAFGRGIVPWEFREGTRSWLLPGILAGAMALSRGEGGMSPVRAAQLLLCVLSLAPIVVTFVATARARGVLAGVVASAAVALWFELVLFAPKALNEVVAAHLLVLGLYLDRMGTQGRRRVLVGLLLGAAVALRVHLAPAVLLAIFCTAGRDWRRWRVVLATMAVVAAVAGLVDLATWGRPFHSYISAVQFNVIEGRSREFGTAPWSAYLTAIWATWSWASLLVVPLAVLGARRWPAAAACALGILATHMAFAHKELRFLYPAIALVIMLAGLGAGELLAWIRPRVRVPPVVIAAALILSWGGASLWRALDYRTTRIDPLDPARESRWTHASWGAESMALAGAKPDLCGVGMVLVSWVWTGGYAYLHRDVPIFLIVNERDGVATAGGYNAVIAPAAAMPNMPEFTLRRCWPGGMCYGERAGACRAVPGEQINERLISWGS
jgi:phosphatidylinositol glycan class B